MKTENERQKKSQALKRERGLVPLNRWVHKDDKPLIIRFIERLSNKRD